MWIPIHRFTASGSVTPNAVSSSPLSESEGYTQHRAFTSQYDEQGGRGRGERRKERRREEALTASGGVT